MKNQKTLFLTQLFKVDLSKRLVLLQKDFDKLEAHSVSLELELQNQSLILGLSEIFLRKSSDVANVKNDIDEIETINIELEHSVATLLKENENLKQTYKKLYDSIKKTRAQTKDQADSLTAQLNYSDDDVKVGEQFHSWDFKISVENGDIKNFFKNRKLDQVGAIVKYCTPNVIGVLTVTLKDLSGIIPSTIYHKVIDEGGYGKGITIGVALILANLQVYGNVIDQKDLYKFDEEALNLTLEEEARKAWAEHEWLEKCRQEEEFDKEHERQL
ncbi:hypothetical protein Tco_1531752 [Tanacetum coccineum]